MAQLTPRERRSEHRARNGNMVDMNLVSLIDVFTILIFFLLSSAAGVEILVSPKAVNLPVAHAEKSPEATVVRQTGQLTQAELEQYVQELLP